MDSVENPAAIMVAAFKKWHPLHSVTVRYDAPDSPETRLPPGAISYCCPDGSDGFFIVLNVNHPMRELMSCLSRALVALHTMLAGGSMDQHMEEFCNTCCAIEEAESRADKIAEASAGTPH